LDEHERAARGYVHCTLNGGRSGGGWRHVYNVPIADIRRTFLTTAVELSQSSSLGDGSCPAAEAVWPTLLDPICKRAL
jgi:hypothetical protein